MKRASLTVLLFLSCLMGFTGQGSAAEKAGLVGIQYGDEDFERAQSFVTLSSLDQIWGEDDGFGRQWAGKWQGFIIAPATGDVKFTIETDREAKIEIAGKVVLNSKSGLTGGSMTMVKGKKYPIVLTYVKEGSEYDCALKVQWGWAGQTPITIEGDSLVHSTQIAAELKAIVGAAEDEDEDGDGGATAAMTMIKNFRFRSCRQLFKRQLRLTSMEQLLMISTAAPTMENASMRSRPSWTTTGNLN